MTRSRKNIFWVLLALVLGFFACLSDLRKRMKRTVI